VGGTAGTKKFTDAVIEAMAPVVAR
jgi:hypothetical protein